MCQDRHAATIKEIQQSIVDPAVAGTELIDAIPQQVGFRTPQLVAEFGQASYSHDAFRKPAPIPSLEFQ
jgi:hypothetical protein